MQEEQTAVRWLIARTTLPSNERVVPPQVVLLLSERLLQVPYLASILVSPAVAVSLAFGMKKGGDITGFL